MPVMIRLNNGSQKHVQQDSNSNYVEPYLILISSHLDLYAMWAMLFLCD